MLFVIRLVLDKAASYGLYRLLHGLLFIEY